MHLQYLSNHSSSYNTESILIPVFALFQYEQTHESARVSQDKYGYRVRSNITRALTALDLTTVSDIQQTSAALAQCTVSKMTGRRGGKARRESRKRRTERKKGNWKKQGIKLEMKETVKKANKRSVLCVFPRR